MRHAGGPVVTASIDALHFLTPIHVGEVVILQARVNFVARTSMEVGVRVDAESPRTRLRRPTTKAYLTFVAIDSSGRPTPLDPLELETDEDRRRFAAAEARRRLRLEGRGR
jgi:acyl-CoA hydrolase